MKLGRTLVIGDIHSGLKALKQLLQRADAQQDDTLIFLGDYVDGWSDAVPTVNFLLDLKEQYHCVFLRGNHDELCYDWLKKGKDNPLWYVHGGSATVASYKNASKETKRAHMAFYEQLRDYYLDQEDRLFLHAGFTNLKGVDFEYDAKTFYWDRTLWELALSLDPRLKREDMHYPKRLTHYREIYIGHTPVTRMGHTTPQRAVNVWNVDTGAAFKGPLTAMDINTKTYWQSDPVHLLYPGETGRNG
ncbi:metallophosphoesterase [Maribacter sp. 2307ULW6-5]|uniref:metallophosphoesterase n=1 Tax=Maribacter sp. 2307ULW6-5 TaxID=3386275 RepID=UPI0039BCD102